ncbi:MAG TPA: divalent metal cation transporter [Candidatus Saccharimonadales bacterium]|nr:divalent metal cation transporter [Candidatus Saccharimonadales bacterium]
MTKPVAPPSVPTGQKADESLTDPSTMLPVQSKVVQNRSRFGRFIRTLGPGVITGAADDDPSGIATYSQTGAQFGYGQLWTVLFMYPLMTAVQEACARIGAVSGKGIAAVVREHYGRKVLYMVVGLVVVANTINIGADIGAMASATRLIIPLPFAFLAISFTVIVLLLEVFVKYKTYVKMLKWLALTLLAYPVTAFIAHQNWGVVFKALLVPHIELSFGFLFLITAVLGTTISPYMFFWQASEEVEEEIAGGRLAQRGGIPHISHHFMRNLRIDNALGMLFSEITTFFIIITAAAVLNSHGVTNINTAADAAKALEPLVSGFPHAGFLAQLIFAVGIVGLGLLAVPVLAGSASYALCEAFEWREGLYRKFRKAHGFYGVITVATLIGLLINFVGIDPVKALIFTAVFNGVAAVPLIFMIARIARSKKIMGEYRSGKLSQTIVAITFVFMLAAAVTMFATLKY